MYPNLKTDLVFLYMVN